MNAKQKIMVNTLLSKANLQKFKEDILLSFSNGRTTDLGDFTYDETNALVKHLNDQMGNDSNQIEKMRKKILALCHEMRWENEGKVDMTRLDEWCKKSGRLHKPFNDYKYNELPALVTQFQAVYQSFLKAL